MKTALARFLFLAVIGAVALLGRATEFPVATSAVQVEGNKAIRTEEILSVIPFKGGEVISEDDLKQASQRIYDLGWFSQVTPDVDEAGAVHFRVTENPVIQSYDISGNVNTEAFQLLGWTLFRTPIMSTDRIRGILRDNDVTTGKMLNNTSLKKALDAILKAYDDKGYALIGLGSVDTQGSVLRIQIVEGRVTENTITGLTTVPESVAQDMIDVPTGVCVKKSVLQATFQRLRGSVYFSNVDVAPQQGSTQDSVQLVWTLEERGLLSAPTPIERIDLQGVTVFPADMAAATLRPLPQGAVSNYQLLRALSGLFDLYYRAGYVMVRLSNAGLVSGRLAVRVDEGAIGSVHVTGNTVTRELVILKTLGLAKDQVLNSGRLAAAYQNLMSLGYFKTVDLTPTWVGDRVQLSVSIVEDTKLGGFNGSISYSPETGGLVGTVSYKQKNLFGTGQDVTASYDHGLVEDKSATWDLEYSTVSAFPQFKRVGAGLYSSSKDQTVYTLNDQQTLAQKTITYYTVGAQGSVTYPLADYTDLGLSYRHEFGRSEEDTNWTPVDSFGISLGYDDVNNPKFPSSGSRRSISLEKAGGFAPGPEFAKLEAVWTAFSPLMLDLPFLTGTQQVAAFRVSCELGFDLPESQMYDFGGTTTIRGVETSPVRRLCFANLEYRVAVLEGLTASLFLDGGVDLDHIEAGAAKSSLGIELGIEAAGMYIRLDAAWPLVSQMSWVPRFSFGFSPMF